MNLQYHDDTQYQEMRVPTHNDYIQNKDASRTDMKYESQINNKNQFDHIPLPNRVDYIQNDHQDIVKAGENQAVRTTDLFKHRKDYAFIEDKRNKNPIGDTRGSHTFNNYHAKRTRKEQRSDYVAPGGNGSGTYKKEGYDAIKRPDRKEIIAIRSRIPCSRRPQKYIPNSDLYQPARRNSNRAARDPGPLPLNITPITWINNAPAMTNTTNIAVETFKNSNKKIIDPSSRNMRMKPKMQFHKSDFK
jgi:hypothetical protein